MEVKLCIYEFKRLNNFTQLNKGILRNGLEVKYAVAICAHGSMNREEWTYPTEPKRYITSANTVN